MKRILVIGGGASGMMAAIQAALNGALVTIYEKSDRIGKKILATGNGKCNLSNTNMELANYYCVDYDKLSECFARFSTGETIRFFENNGLMIKDRNGYLYPYCEQASVVLDILRITLKKNKVAIFTGVTDIHLSVKKNNNFIVESSVGKKEYDSVILACGSKAGMKNATTEGYDYAKEFGHRIIPLLPALVQVRCKEDIFPSIAGVRCRAKVSLYLERDFIACDEGELQLTDYGISGIPVFQISRIIAKELKAKRNISVIIDFIPGMTDIEWGNFVADRIATYHGFTLEEFMIGLLHKKIGLMLLKKYGLKPDDILDGSNREPLALLCNTMKKFVVTPQEVNNFEHAQVCSGGVDYTELTDCLESVYQPGLFICGEMVDVDGKCGGYNLQWAWTSGYIAGIFAAK